MSQVYLVKLFQPWQFSLCHFIKQENSQYLEHSSLSTASAPAEPTAPVPGTPTATVPWRPWRHSQCSDLALCPRPMEAMEAMEAQLVLRPGPLPPSRGGLWQLAHSCTLPTLLGRCSWSWCIRVPRNGKPPPPAPSHSCAA